jgi:ABC-type sugar transport system ATPase subunit
VSDRILCMRGGKLVREFRASEADPEKVMRVLAGGEAA